MMLGIDVSKESLVCALFDPQTERFRWERTYSNSAAGVSKLLADAPVAAPWVLEPTGRYSLPVAKLARESGRSVLLASPKKARAYLQSIQGRAKTDRLDGRGLALFAATRPRCEPLPPYPIKSESVERLDQLLTARKGLVRALTSLRLQAAELHHAAGPLRQAIAALTAQRKELDKQIAALSGDQTEFPETAKLRAVPGIGPVTAAALASRLKARNFERGDQFVAYVGLDIGVIKSGKRLGERGLTKQGDDELRRLLFLCARASLCNKNSPFKARYDQEVARGRSKTAAACIIARKLARIAWSIVHHGTEYKTEWVYQQRPAEADRPAPDRDSSTPAGQLSPSGEATCPPAPAHSVDGCASRQSDPSQTSA